MLTFAGMQKLTLIDYPGRTACTLFMRGCNFVCPFCHNASLIAFGEDGAETLSHEYVFDFLRKRKGMLDGVCISGGEPLAQEGIFNFAREAKELGYLVKIDTNGSFPDRLKELAESGLIDYVAMDIKNAPEKYRQTIGVPGFDTAPVEESITFLLEGKVAYEFRTTVVRGFHVPGDIVSIAKRIAGAEKYFLQRFDNPERALRPGLEAYSDSEMQEICKAARAVLPCTVVR